MDPAPAILVVCTGNICRSPMAAGLLAGRLAERGIAARVTSTGTTRAGLPATAEACAAVAAHGVDISAHVSRVIDRSQVAAADLVLGMERQHVREAVVLDHGAAERAFTLKELVRRAAERPRLPDEALAPWLARMASVRTRAELLGLSRDVEAVTDPFRRPQAAYDACATELAALVDQIVDLVWPARVGAGGVA